MLELTSSTIGSSSITRILAPLDELAAEESGICSLTTASSAGSSSVKLVPLRGTDFT